MPIYQYKALTPNGKTKVGVLDADTPRDARELLQSDNVHVIEIEQVSQQKKKKEKGFRGWKQHQSKKRLLEVSNVTRQLSTMLAAGIQLSEALTTIVDQIEDPSLQTIFREIREKIQGGQSFADALESFPEHFTDLYISLVRAGEASGNLDLTLGRLSDYLREQYRIQAKLSAAMAYPMVMLVVGVGVVGFLLAFVVPKIRKILVQQDKALPLPTEILLAVSDFLQSYWHMLGAGGMTSYLLFLWYVSGPGRYGWDKFKLRVPVFGELLRKHAVSRFAKTFSALIEGGLPVDKSLLIVKDVTGNKVMEKVIAQVHDRIMEGADISGPLKSSGVFPPTVGYMIAVGEQAGNLGEMLERVADSYDEEIEISTEKFLSLIEPVMIVLLAVIVGFIVLSIILPILKISQFGH
ncbi:MAG: type II secretion system F family protein [Planctomycetota bacterium]|jgi:general secretion pathway protein F|nr:type II secretion system F family protein [Planctomycetota bacterium]